jgi:hypothetical protein
LQLDPLIHPGLPAFQGRQHASLRGAPHLRRRHPGGTGHLLERGRQPHLVLITWVERHLHRPAALCGIQPPHQSLFARATGPSDSRAGRPRPKRPARPTASTRPPHHRRADNARTTTAPSPVSDDLGSVPGHHCHRPVSDRESSHKYSLRLAQATSGSARDPRDLADVSEFCLRILMQRSASSFMINNAVRGAWLSTGIHPLGGPDRRVRAVGDCSGGASSGAQIIRL